MLLCSRSRHVSTATAHSCYASTCTAQEQKGLTVVRPSLERGDFALSAFSSLRVRIAESRLADSALCSSVSTAVRVLSAERRAVNVQ